MEVWLADTGDYEQNYVSDVGVSVSAVVAAIRMRYAAPYIVRWEPVADAS